VDRLNCLQAFRHVAELESFTAAASKLHVSPAMISKYINQLEARLGVRLFTRSTRKVKLTNEGEHYFRRIATLLDELELADQEIAQDNHTLHGELKLTAPVDLGERFLFDVVTHFQKANPKMSVTLDLTDRQVNLIEENYDIAIRVGKVAGQDLVLRKFMTMDLVLCASSTYLQQAPQLKHPRDLKQHRCLINQSVRDPDRWQFVVDNKSYSTKVNSMLRINSGRSLADAAIQGLGLLYTPTVLVEAALKQGSLVECLKEFTIPAVDVFAVYPSRLFVPAKVRRFIDTLVEHTNSFPGSVNQNQPQ
jgi:DNA-binding transcriptional LysR family regulator